MLPARTALPLVAILAAAPAFAADAAERSEEAPRRPHVTLDLSLGLGGGNSGDRAEGQLAYGLHATARPGPVVLAGSMEGATNVVGSGHLFLTGGIGSWEDVGRGRVVFLGLFGTHVIEVLRVSGSAPEHRLPVLGARAVWEFDAGRWLMGRASLAASGYVDLKRERDPYVLAGAGGDVGGVTVLLSVALGLGV